MTPTFTCTYIGSFILQTAAQEVPGYNSTASRHHETPHPTTRRTTTIVNKFEENAKCFSPYVTSRQKSPSTIPYHTIPPQSHDHSTLPWFSLKEHTKKKTKGKKKRNVSTPLLVHSFTHITRSTRSVGQPHTEN